MNARGHLFFSAGEPHVSSQWGGAREPARPDVIKLPPLIDMDGVNVFILCASLLFVAQMATYAGLLFMASALVFALRHRHRLGEIPRAHGLFLVFPAFAILSTFWSDVAPETLRHGIEFALTVGAALLLARVRNRRSMMFALFAVFAFYCVTSLVFGSMSEIGTSGTTAFVGLSDSKNEEASIDSMGAIITLAWIFISFSTRCYFQGITALPVFVIEIYAAVMARSALALAATAVGVCIFLLLALLVRAGQGLRAALVAIGGTTALCLALVLMIFTAPIVDLISGWLGKDVTLTGRTYLWGLARDLIAEQPLLGRGFAAFWQQGNVDAQGAWQYAHMGTRTGFNFQNTGYDVLVSLGWVGFILFALTLITGFTRTAVAYVKGPSLLSAFWLAMGAGLLLRLPTETMGITEFSIATILLFASFNYVPATTREPFQSRSSCQAGAGLALHSVARR